MKPFLKYSHSKHMFDPSPSFPIVIKESGVREKKIEASKRKEKAEERCRGEESRRREWKRRQQEKRKEGSAVE